MPQPLIATSAVFHDFGTTTNTWSFEVWNAGDPNSELTFHVASDQDWLELSPLTNVSADATDRKTIVATLDRAILTDDTNLGTVFISGFQLNTAAITVTASVAKALHVNANNTPGLEDGESWETAYTSIQAAIDKADELYIHEIWIAGGSYPEALRVPDGMRIFGGFSGATGEKAIEGERDWIAYPTVIDGGQRLRCLETSGDVILDGLIIQNGMAEAGGGLLAIGGEVLIANCTFADNQAEWGAAIYAAKQSSIIIENSLLTGNTTSSETGGVIALESSEAFVDSSSMRGNSATAFSKDKDSRIEFSRTVFRATIAPEPVPVAPAP
jgi:hypothetical protein